MSTPARPIHELLEEREVVRKALLDAQDKVESLNSMLHEFDRSLKKAGYVEPDDVPTAGTFEDMSISVPPFKVRAGDVFVQILSHIDRWMSERELYARARFIGLKESTPGDFKRSLAAFKSRIRRRKSDGFVGLTEWPDGK